MESNQPKSLQLLEIARATLQRGEIDAAERMVVLAMRTDDAIEALDRLLPKVPEPEISAEDLELSPQQIAKITALARDLKATRHQKIVTALLGRVERIEAAQAARKATRATAVPQKYAEIDLKPPKGVREAARKGLDLRKQYGRGGTEVGVARARDLSNGRQLSPSTVRRMQKFFARQAKNADHVLDNGEPGNGKIAWLLWGGDPGVTWAAKVCKQLDHADKKD